MFFQIYFFSLYIKYFKNSNIEIVKKINPTILELGQIAKDLNVGEINIESDKIKSIFFSM